MDRYFDWSNVYHVGIVVPDLHQAMNDLAVELGVSWPEPQSRLGKRFRTQNGTLETEMHFVYSIEGPPHLELIEAQPGTPWEVEGPGIIHHVGVWVDDLASASAELVTAGAGIEITYDTPELQSFTYHVTSAGLRVELVDVARRPGVEAWLGYDAVS